MLKKFFSFLIICFAMKTIIGEEVEKQDNIEANLEMQNSATQNEILFDVKNSDIFENCVKSLSDEEREKLQSFINQFEQKLLDDIEFNDLLKQYREIFTKLNLVEKALPKVTLIFAFYRENWTDLVKTEEFDVDILKNTISEDQANTLNLDLANITHAFELIVERVQKLVATELDMSSVYKSIKEKNGNQKIRISIILGLSQKNL